MLLSYLEEVPFRAVGANAGGTTRRPLVLQWTGGVFY